MASDMNIAIEFVSAEPAGMKSMPVSGSFCTTCLSVACPSRKSAMPSAPSACISRPKEGWRTSQSSTITRSPLIAAERPRPTAIVVLPSAGRAAVIAMTRGFSRPSQSAARSARSCSEKGESGFSAG